MSKDIEKDDMVDHPSHYNQGKIEVIDAIEDWGLGFHLGSAVKYIARAKYKGKEKEDLQKALWYIQRFIDERNEMKYVLRHKWIVEGGYNQYLSKCTNDGVLYCELDYFSVFDVDRIGFTKKEIEEIKDKYDTDLADFEILEGARWQNE